MNNELKHLEEFKQILSNYKISESSQDILKKTKLVLMLGPSSTGRNALIKELIKTGNYHFIVSDTTRHPRSNDGILEQNGHEYWFRKEEDVLEDLKHGRFLEAEILHDQQVSGISIRELEKASTENKYAITDIDLLGMENVVKAKPDTVSLLVLPPNFEEWQRRMDTRGKLPEDEKRRRIQTAVRILNAGLAHEYYIYIINDTIEDAIKQISAAIDENINVEEQNGCKEIAAELLYKTKQWLENN